MDQRETSPLAFTSLINQSLLMALSDTESSSSHLMKDSSFSLVIPKHRKRSYVVPSPAIRRTSGRFIFRLCITSIIILVTDFDFLAVAFIVSHLFALLMTSNNGFCFSFDEGLFYYFEMRTDVQKPQFYTCEKSLNEQLTFQS
ncbi:MAG: hypothetical protein OXE77_02195 [Flavobacteriaceae bacterium]|nr:hypothetical protein [Flavobacteriaceae bacterium]